MVGQRVVYWGERVGERIAFHIAANIYMSSPLHSLRSGPVPCPLKINP